jgi:hypothetical protein
MFKPFRICDPKMVYNRNYLLPRQAPFSAMKPGIGVPLQSPYEAYIELDERIYNPGDVITGKLHLELKKKLTCDVIKIQLFGSVRVFFIKSVSSNTPGKLSRNQAYEQEIVLIDKDINVWEAPATGEPRQEVTVGIYFRGGTFLADLNQKILKSKLWNLSFNQYRYFNFQFC